MLDAFLEKMDEVFEKDSLLFHFNVYMQCVCVFSVCSHMWGVHVCTDGGQRLTMGVFLD